MIRVVARGARRDLERGARNRFSFRSGFGSDFRPSPELSDLLSSRGQLLCERRHLVPEGGLTVLVFLDLVPGLSQLRLQSLHSLFMHSLLFRQLFLGAIHFLAEQSAHRLRSL